MKIGARVSFRHPLVRSATYRAASPDERREVHRALAEANPDVVCRIDRRGVFLDLVVPDDADFPFSYEQFVGKTATEIMGPEFAAAQQHYVEEALAKGQLQIWEHHGHRARRDGARRAAT